MVRAGIGLLALALPPLIGFHPYYLYLLGTAFLWASVASAWSLPAIMAATCGDVLGPALAPAALGFITLFFGLGQALGPSLAGALADATGTFAQAYVLAGVVAVLGAGGASLLRPASTARREA